MVGIASYEVIGWESFFLRKGWLLPSDIVGQLSICQLHYGAQLHHRKVHGTYRMIKTTTVVGKCEVFFGNLCRHGDGPYVMVTAYAA